MSGFVPIAVAMQHLRAETADQSYVEVLLEAAEDSAEQFLGRKVFADQSAMDDAVDAGTAGDAPLVVTPSITAACLLILGSLYANREDVAPGITLSELPMGSRTLLQPYRVGMGV